MRIAGPPDIAVDVAGTGPLLIFLHGVGGNRHNWSDQVAHFSARFTAVSWDARGYGDSDDAPDREFTNFADDLARVISHFGGPAHLVGLSMGGRIALDCWRRYPLLVASLTLANTSAGAAPTEKASARGNSGAGGRKAVLAAIEAVLIAKNVPEKQRDAVMAAATEKLAQRIRDGQAPKVKVYDSAAPSQRPAVVPTPEMQRARDRAAPAPAR
jgi:pimeloyl-ACP methyl ester carboxylesterase